MPARQFYLLNDEYKDLQNTFGRPGKNEAGRPDTLTKSLERKIRLFDFFDEQDGRIINPFSHFRHIGHDLVRLLRPAMGMDQLERNTETGVSINSPTAANAEQSIRSMPVTPRKLLVEEYRDSPTHTPPAIQDTAEESAEESGTPSYSQIFIDDNVATDIELKRSDLATLFQALLVARDIDVMEGEEAITAILSRSKTLDKPTIDRLLGNPAFQERYCVEDTPIDDAIPSTQPALSNLIVDLRDDTAAVVWAMLASRAIDPALPYSVAVKQLKSPRVSEDVAKRALANPRLEARRRRKRKADTAAALEIKKEAEMVRLQRVEAQQLAPSANSRSKNHTEETTSRVILDTHDSDLQQGPVASQSSRPSPPYRLRKRSRR